jgi:hypothetical protein
MKPNYKVKVLNKKSSLKGHIGAAWINEDGTISIVLDNYISLYQDGNILITLFPTDKPNKSDI